MRYMIIVRASPESEAGILPTREAFARMHAFNATMVKAGVMLAAEGLHPSAEGARIRFDAGGYTVIDGPFTGTKELIAGFWLIEVASREEAVAWMSRAPFDGGAEIEVRRVFEMDA